MSPGCKSRERWGFSRGPTPAGLMLQPVPLPRGLHPGLFCSTPSGWLSDHSHGGSAVTMRVSRGRRWRPRKSRIDEPRVQTLGRMEFLRRFNPAGVEQRSCSESYAPVMSVSESQQHHAYGAPVITWLRDEASDTGIDLKVDGRWLDFSMSLWTSSLTFREASASLKGSRLSLRSSSCPRRWPTAAGSSS